MINIVATGIGASTKNGSITDALAAGLTQDEMDGDLRKKPVQPTAATSQSHDYEPVDLDDGEEDMLGIITRPKPSLPPPLPLSSSFSSLLKEPSAKSPRSNRVVVNRLSMTGHERETFSEGVSSFLPPRVRDKLAMSEKTGHKLTVPQKGCVTACVAFLDMCGFTKLLFKMKSWSRWSKWPRYLQTYFQKLTNSADEHGIDLYKFAGDLLIFYLVVDDSAAARKQAASQMVQWVQLALKEAQVCNDGVTLQMHAGFYWLSGVTDGDNDKINQSIRSISRRYIGRIVIGPPPNARRRGYGKPARDTSGRRIYQHWTQYSLRLYLMRRSAQRTVQGELSG